MHLRFLVSCAVGVASFPPILALRPNTGVYEAKAPKVNDNASIHEGDESSPRLFNWSTYIEKRAPTAPNFHPNQSLLNEADSLRFWLENEILSDSGLSYRDFARRFAPYFVRKFSYLTPKQQRINRNARTHFPNLTLDQLQHQFLNDEVFFRACVDGADFRPGCARVLQSSLEVEYIIVKAIVQFQTKECPGYIKDLGKHDFLEFISAETLPMWYNPRKAQTGSTYFGSASDLFALPSGETILAEPFRREIRFQRTPHATHHTLTLPTPEGASMREHKALILSDEGKHLWHINSDFAKATSGILHPDCHVVREPKQDLGLLQFQCAYLFPFCSLLLSLLSGLLWFVVRNSEQRLSVVENEGEQSDSEEVAPTDEKESQIQVFLGLKLIDGFCYLESVVCGKTNLWSQSAADKCRRIQGCVGNMFFRPFSGLTARLSSLANAFAVGFRSRMIVAKAVCESVLRFISEFQCFNYGRAGEDFVHVVEPEETVLVEVLPRKFGWWGLGKQ